MFNLASSWCGAGSPPTPLRSAVGQGTVTQAFLYIKKEAKI